MATRFLKISSNGNKILKSKLMTAPSYMIFFNFSCLFSIDELVTAAVRTNYGQVPSSVHAFVGSVAVAGAEGGLWSIEGGNHLLPEKLLLLSEAVVVQSKVSHYDLRGCQNGQPT